MLFLDMDGVLNRTGYHPVESHGLRSWIEPDLARRLNEVVERTASVIVLSSDGRLGRSSAELRIELRGGGIDAVLHDVTPQRPALVRGRGVARRY